MKKAEIARELGVSRAYITMLAKGERKPSKRLQQKINRLTGKCSLSGVNEPLPKQDVESSNPFTRFFPKKTSVLLLIYP